MYIFAKFLKSYLHTVTWYQVSLYITKNLQADLLGSIDGILTSNTNPGESGPGSNGNEGFFIIPKVTEVKPQYQLKFTRFFERELNYL